MQLRTVLQLMCSVQGVNDESIMLRSSGERLFAQNQDLTRYSTSQEGSVSTVNADGTTAHSAS